MNYIKAKHAHRNTKSVVDFNNIATIRQYELDLAKGEAWAFQAKTLFDEIQAASTRKVRPAFWHQINLAEFFGKDQDSVRRMERTLDVCRALGYKIEYSPNGHSVRVDWSDAYEKPVTWM